MASGVAVVEDFVGDAVVGDAAVVEAAVDDVSVDEASAGDAAVLAGVLRDGGVLDLLLRLQRGKPRTIEQIREIAPPGIDLGASLLALERAGLVRVDAEGLRIAPPEPLVAGAVTGELAAARERLGRWRELFAGLAAGSGAGAGSKPPVLATSVLAASALAARSSPPFDGRSIAMRVVVGDAGTLWDRMTEVGGGSERGDDGRAGDGVELGIIVPDLSQVREELRGAGTDLGLDTGPAGAAEARLAGSQILVDARSLADPALVPVLDGLRAAGDRIRLSAAPPCWLAVGRSGQAAVSSDAALRPLSSLVLVEAPPVVAALHAVFASEWDAAQPYPLGGGASDAGTSGAEVSHTEAPGIDDTGQDTTDTGADTATATAGSLVDDGLALRALGLSDDEVARALGCSARTLQREFSALMRRIGVRSRFELGAWWARRQGQQGRQGQQSTRCEPGRPGDRGPDGPRQTREGHR
uniref:hypothetical protein n=2 Tax=Leucobacter soli TaxID=2812850 RepID=UPI001C403904|nr:hypothetical protein [Leucobacter soli]